VVVAVASIQGLYCLLWRQYCHSLKASAVHLPVQSGW